MKKKQKVICNYCDSEAVLTHGLKIYPRRPDLHSLLFWICHPCDAFVGCHKKSSGRYGQDGTIPLGNLATKELRKMRMVAHNHFDTLWKGGSITRGSAYFSLANHLGVCNTACHIGQFNKEQCEKTIEFVVAFDFDNEES